MKSGLYERFAALAAAMSLWASPAMAQITNLDQLSEEQGKEIYCLHDELWFEPESYTLVVDTFLYGEKAEEAEAAIKKAAQACASKYKWDAAKQDLGMRAGLASAINRYLIEELYGHGATDADIEAIDRVMRTMPKADIERFLDDSWLEDAAFIKRIDALLLAEKFSGGGEHALELARFIIEAHLTKSAAALEWVRTYVNR